MSWSERELHRFLLEAFARPRGLRGSRGHDAAVLAAPRGRLVACVDQTIEGVHFARGTTPARAGRKAAARALSDLAATAARPRFLLCALAAPRAAEARWLKGFLRAVDAEARRHGAELVGGDLACTPGALVASITALGELGSGLDAPGRDRARAGDVVLVTGALGGSSLGRHLRIEPRFEAGRALVRAGARALMDVSDGLLLDLTRLAERSGVAIELDPARVPVHADASRLASASGRLPLQHALSDGEDHELIATLPRRRFEAQASLLLRHASGMRLIGRVVPGRGVWLVEGGRHRRPRGSLGYVHGARV